MDRRVSAAILAALLLVAIGSIPQLGLPAPVAASCSGWTSESVPPPTIRVLRTATGVVETVDFKTYVKNVLSREWISSWTTESLRSGALAVKNYAWYWVLNWRGLKNSAGECFDVRDSTLDQHYDPSRPTYASMAAAVDATWDTLALKDGRIFPAYYNAGAVDEPCGANHNGWRMFQWGTQACGLDGLTAAQIMTTYYYPGVTISSAPPPSSTLTVLRRSGSDRYASAAAISAAQFNPGVAVAYVATGRNFPDALVGGVLAGRRGGPVLLVTASSIPTPTANELSRLRPGRIVILGGPVSVSEGVRASLASYATSGVVERLAGADRYATAAAISVAAFAATVPVAYIATGTNFPDALSGIPLAAMNGGPILLATSDTVPAATASELNRLQPGRIVIVGGPASVSDAVVAQLQGYTRGSVTRLAGADRYATAVSVSKAGFAAASTVFIATGTNYPDALAGGPVATIVGGPLLLVTRDNVPPVVRQELQRLAPRTVIILGGPASVSETVVDQIRSLLP